MQWVKLVIIPRKISEELEKCWRTRAVNHRFCGFSTRLARACVGPVKITSETGILTGGKWLEAVILCRNSCWPCGREELVQLYN
jgi:hypothetical protein